MKIRLSLWIGCWCITMSLSAYTQDKLPSCACMSGDSAWKAGMESRLKEIISRLADDSLPQRNRAANSPTTSLKMKPSLHNNSLSYTANYVSRIEGVYDYGNILQQGFMYQADAGLINQIPFRVIINGRKSNSPYFRDYIDVNITLRNSAFSSVDELTRSNFLKQQVALLEKFYREKIKYLDSLKNSVDKPGTDECLNLYIHSKEVLSNEKTYKDSFLVKDGKDTLDFAKQFTGYYERLLYYKDSIRLKIDSLVTSTKRGLSDIEDASDMKTPDFKLLSSKVLRHSGNFRHFDTSLAKPEQSFLSRFKKLSFGRTMPSSSQLNFQNMSVNGINAEYQLSKSFVALQAGWADLGFRDFVFDKSQRRISDFVYSVGAGIGNHASNYLMVSLFGGAKRNDYGEKSNILGTSIAAQVTRRHITWQGEIAQASFPKNNRTYAGNKVWLKDNSNKAYSMSLYSNWDKLSLNASGYYKYYGINYYGFNSFRIDATNNLWGWQVDKSFFGQSLNVSASVKKNDYKNPYVYQVYNGVNIVRSFNATFRKTGYPVVSAGYIPSFQYVSINDTVYENSYQVINLLVSYPYTIGILSAVSGIVVNRFMDGAGKAGYFYSNSLNIIGTQTVSFEKYTSSFNVSVLKNPMYTYTVFDGCVSSRLNAFLEAKIGFRVNNMVAESPVSKLGGYGSLGGTIGKLGTISISVDRNYYPDMLRQLYGNTIGSMTFTTYFK